MSGGPALRPPAPDWFARPVQEVAVSLLGAVVTTEREGGEVSVRLTEVEAYAGPVDPGSHAFRGPTARNATMFGPAGRLYVYRHMGLHHCVNLVVGDEGDPAAVLLRAGEVVGGAAVALERRRAAGVARRAEDLARGPARLAVALGLSAADDGTPVDGVVTRLVVPEAVPDDAVVRRGPRVGVSGPGGDGEAFPWRFWLEGEPTVSSYRAAPRPGRTRRTVGGTGRTSRAH
jgi:DNA-3-methyladenine glycosylase